jgi:hypothetical protein
MEELPVVISDPELLPVLLMKKQKRTYRRIRLTKPTKLNYFFYSYTGIADIISINVAEPEPYHRLCSSRSCIKIFSCFFKFCTIPVPV